MDINKGLFLDGYVTDKEHGGWEYAKNTLLADGFKSAKTEEGFDHDIDAILTFINSSGSGIGDSPLGWAKVVGHLNVKDFVLLYVSLDYGDPDSPIQAGSVILKYTPSTNTYETILNLFTDTSYTAPFYFHHDYYVDSIYTYTPSSDLIIALCNGTDDDCIEPILINVDKRNEYYLNENKVLYEDLMYLFNRTEHIIDDISAIEDGELEVGVYYITARFEYIDGTKSNWSMLSQPIKLGSNPDKPIRSSIVINGEYTGTFGYSYVDIAYVYKSNGIVKAYEYGNFAISHELVSSEYVYSFQVIIDSNSGNEVDLDSLLIRKAFYRKAASIEFTNNKIYLADVKEENNNIAFENFAKDIVVKYDITHRDLGDPNRYTLAPGEVYALYSYFILKGSGIKSKPYFISGREDYFSGDQFYRNFDTFSDGGSLTHTSSTKFEYTFPDASDWQSQNLKCTFTFFSNTDVEVVLTETVDFSVNGLTAIAIAISDISITYGLGITAVANVSSSYIIVLCNDQLGNGFNVTYNVINSQTDEDQTYLLNNFITLNNTFEHTVHGTRNVNDATYRYLGYWKNTNDDLLHHRMPTLKKLFADVDGTSVNAFSVDKFASIKLQFSNIVIPSEIADKISYIGFGFAKRTSENKMFYGDSLLMNYHKIDDSLYLTALDSILKDGYNKYANTTPIINTYSKSYIGLDNFDILNNNLKVNITNVTPEYTMQYADMDMKTFRCTDEFIVDDDDNDIDNQYIRGTLPYRALNMKSLAIDTLIYDENFEISANINIPHNSIIRTDTNLSYEIEPVVSTDSRYRSRSGTFSLDAAIDNIGGQKHIFAILGSSYNHEIVDQGASKTITNFGRLLSDEQGETYNFQSGDGGGKTCMGAITEIAVGSIYSIKDDVYIDVDSQDVIPLGYPQEITAAGRYTFEYDGVGDITVGEKFTLISSDAFLDTVSPIQDPGSSIFTHEEARSFAINHAKASSIVLGNKLTLKHLSYGISDVSKRYRKDSTDPQSDIYMKIGKESVFSHNIYEEPTIQYENDYNSLQDLDIPIFTKDTEELQINKIIRSITYANEAIDTSALKSFLADNYYMMPSKYKQIINIKELGNGLIIQQRQGLSYAYIKDYLDLQGSNAYLGTGTLFDRKPTPIKYAETDSVSCAHILSSIITDFGYCVFDDYYNKLYMFDGTKLHTLSNNHAHEYFRDNYDFSANEYNPLKLGIENGVLLTYDSHNKNLHIIKKLTNGDNNNLSFSFSINNFLSFHSWIPDYMFNVNSLVYSLNGDNMYRHNSNDKIGLYYTAIPETSIVDVIFIGDKEQSKLFEAVNWQTQAIDLLLGINDPSITFDNVLIYNDDQSSGYVEITNPSTDSSWFDKTARDIAKSWNFNKFRDAVYSIGKLFTDNEPNTSVVDASKKNWFDKSTFSSKHIIVRLKASNTLYDDGDSGTKQYKIILNNVNVKASINKR